MKILYVTAIELDTDGGPKTHIIEMIMEWDKIGHDILLLAPSFNNELLKLPVGIINYPFFGYSLLRRAFSYLLMSFVLLGCILKFRPEIIYERQMEFNPTIWLLCKLYKLPFFLEINGLMTEDLEKTGAWSISIFLQKVIEGKEVNSATGIFCTSPLLREKIATKYHDISDRVIFIANGVNRDLFHPRNKEKCRIKMGFRPEKKYIGYVGTFNHLQNSEQLIENFVKVAKKIPEAQLIMVGDGPTKKYCQKLVSDFNLTERVVFTGLINYGDVPLYINCFHVGLVPASKLRLEREGVVSFKLQEFLACGCPTIAHYLSKNDYDKFCQFIKMAHIDDKYSLSDAVIELLENQDKCTSLAERALSYIKDNVSWEKSASKTINIIEKRIQSTQSCNE